MAARPGGWREPTEADLFEAFCKFMKSTDHGDAPKNSFPEVRHVVADERQRASGYLLHHQTVNAMAYLGLFDAAEQLSIRDLNLIDRLWPSLAPGNDGRCTFAAFKRAVQQHVSSEREERRRAPDGRHAALRHSDEHARPPSSPDFTYHPGNLPTRLERMLEERALQKSRSGSNRRGRPGGGALTYADRTVSPPRSPGSYGAPASPPPRLQAGAVNADQATYYHADPATGRVEISWERSKTSRESPERSPPPRRAERALREQNLRLRQELRLLVRDRKAWEATSKSLGAPCTAHEGESGRSVPHGAGKKYVWERGASGNLGASPSSISSGDSSDSDALRDDALRKRWSNTEQGLLQEQDCLRARLAKERERQRRREEAMRAYSTQEPPLDRAAAKRQGWLAHEGDGHTTPSRTAIPVYLTVDLGRRAAFGDLTRQGPSAVRAWKRAGAKDAAAGFGLSEADVRLHAKEVEPGVVRLKFRVPASPSAAARTQSMLEDRLQRYPSSRLEEASRSFENQTRVASGCHLLLDRSWVGKAKPASKTSSIAQKGDVCFLVDQPYDSFRAAPFQAALVDHMRDPGVYLQLVEVAPKKGKTAATFRVNGTDDDARASKNLAAAANDSRAPLHKDVSRIDEGWLVKTGRGSASSTDLTYSESQRSTTRTKPRRSGKSKKSAASVKVPPPPPELSSSSSSSSAAPKKKTKARAQEPRPEKKPGGASVKVPAPAGGKTRDSSPSSSSSAAAASRGRKPRREKESGGGSPPADPRVVHQTFDVVHHVHRRSSAAPVVETKMSPVHGPQASPPAKRAPLKTASKFPHAAPPEAARPSSSSASSDGRGEREKLVHRTHSIEHVVIRRTEESPVLKTKMSPVHKAKPAPHDFAQPHDKSPSSHGEGGVDEASRSVRVKVVKREEVHGEVASATSPRHAPAASPPASPAAAADGKPKRKRRRPSAGAERRRPSSPSSSSGREPDLLPPPAIPAHTASASSSSPSASPPKRTLGSPKSAHPAPNPAPRVVAPSGQGPGVRKGVVEVAPVKTGTPASSPTHAAGLPSYGYEKMQSFDPLNPTPQQVSQSPPTSPRFGTVKAPHPSP
ncbi:hypothetical protein DIPPA_18560 [Diplonema papillatum]|nr:hypothetical protein DIPPA_18560 [Diplonema papillatum]